MDLHVLKIGNLMGTPDAKEMLLRAGPGSDAAHALWFAIARIKTAFGFNGQCTSLLLTDDDQPDAFPALVDPSFISATGELTGSVDRALDAVRAAGVDPGEVRSVLATHAHPDHFDPRLLEHLPNAVAYAHPDAPVPGCEPFDPEHFDGIVDALCTPGHGGPHTSYLLELETYDLVVCLAGDLVMSQAHYLARHHPLSFTDPAEGLKSIEKVRQALLAWGRAYNLVFPGHDLPFFMLDEPAG